MCAVQPILNSAPLPPGAPGWITPELIAETIETWQPYYGEDLTQADALGILESVSSLFDRKEGSR